MSLLSLLRAPLLSHALPVLRVPRAVVRVLRFALRHACSAMPFASVPVRVLRRERVAAHAAILAMRDGRFLVGMRDDVVSCRDRFEMSRIHACERLAVMVDVVARRYRATRDLHGGAVRRCLPLS